jgi:hypothetical protein
MLRSVLTFAMGALLSALALTGRDRIRPTIFPFAYRSPGEVSDLTKGVGCTRMVEHVLKKNYSPDGIVEERSTEPYHWALKLSSDGTRVEILSDSAIKSGSTTPFSYRIVATYEDVVTASMETFTGLAAPEFLSIDLTKGVMLTGTASVPIYPRASLAYWQCQ